MSTESRNKDEEETKKRDHIGEYEESDKCPECRSKKLVHDYERAELVCRNCGLVIDDEFIDTGPDWRAFDSEERSKKMRIGAPMDVMTHDKGLSTNIGTGSRDSNGNSISASKKTKFYRLRKWHRQSKFSDSRERDLALALGELDRISSQLNIPKSVSEDASRIYRKIAEKGLVKGRSIEAMVGSSIYIACRQNKIPRTLDEISDSARVSRKEIGRAYRYVASELGIMLAPASPEEYVPRFCSELGLSNKVQFKANEILKKASEKELTSGRDPTSIAAAGIYIASVKCGEKRSQKEVAQSASTTEVTVRNRYQELCKELDIELDTQK